MPGCSSDLLNIFSERVGLLELKIAIVIEFYAFDNVQIVYKISKEVASLLKCQSNFNTYLFLF